MVSESEDSKLNKENLNPGETGSVMNYNGQPFVRIGDRFLWVRVTPGRIQEKGVRNPQLKVGDRQTRGSTVQWKPGESVQTHGAPRFHLSLSQSSRRKRKPPRSQDFLRGGGGNLNNYQLTSTIRRRPLGGKNFFEFVHRKHNWKPLKNSKKLSFNKW